MALGSGVPGHLDVNFQKLAPNLNIANGVIVPVRQEVEGGDITIVAGVANAHVVVDITGYFSKAGPRKYYLTPDPFAGFDGSQALTACAAGYHMASIWEILDPSNLSYNTVLGATDDDSGAGPLVGQGGWIRTGQGSISSPQPGVTNCFAWSSPDAPVNGTYALVNGNWAAASTVIGPWRAIVVPCNSTAQVWCVED